MIHRCSTRPRGAALILVLMITGVLGILLLQVGLTARQNVADAQRLQDRAEAWMLLRSSETAVQFALLTNEWEKPPGSAPDVFLDAWSFRGQAFSVAGATYRIQDQSGLVPMPLPGESVDLLRKLLVALGFEPERAESIVRQYENVISSQPSSGSDFGDRVTPNPLQSFGELRSSTDMTAAELAQLEEVATLYPVGFFNPLTAPPAVIAARVDGFAIDSLAVLQQEGRLTQEAWLELTGQGIDEFTSFYPGPGFRIDVSVEYKGIIQSRRSVLAIQPYDADPISLWSRHRNRGVSEAL